MNSLILLTAVRFLLPLLLLFSLMVFLRGHNQPGGGFTGGLIAVAAVALYAIARGASAARRLLLAAPQVLIGSGLLVAVLSGASPLLFGKPFLTGLWVPLSIAGGAVEVGTPLVFDLGVYLVVVGVTLLIILSLAEE